MNNPSFYIKSLMHFVKLLLWRKIKQVLIMRPHIFSFSWLCFKTKEIKCIRIPLVSQNNNKKSLWSRHCHFHLNARHWCEDWEGFVKFADREMWWEECWEIPLSSIPHIPPPAPQWPWWPAPDITCCCCGAGEEMLMEFEMMLKSRAGDWSDECTPTWEQPSLYFHLLWKCNV